MNLYFIFKSKLILYLAVFIRAFFLIHVLKRLKELRVSDDVSENTIISNKRILINNINLKKHPRNKYFLGIGLNTLKTNIDSLIQPYLNLKNINKKNINILLIGPRSESEVFRLLSYGFEKKNLSSIDLFSYSDYIDLCDAHNLNYDNHKFDLIICGWVVAYSNNKIKLLNEIKRVGKKNCTYLFGYSFNKNSDKIIIEERGYNVSSKNLRVFNKKELINLFERCNYEIFYMKRLNTFSDTNYKYSIIAN